MFPNVCAVCAVLWKTKRNAWILASFVPSAVKPNELVKHAPESGALTDEARWQDLLVSAPMRYDSTRQATLGSKEYWFILDNGLTATRRQAITWTNKGPAYWGIYAIIYHCFRLCDLLSLWCLPRINHFTPASWQSYSNMDWSVSLI